MRPAGMVCRDTSGQSRFSRGYYLKKSAIFCPGVRCEDLRESGGAEFATRLYLAETGRFLGEFLRENGAKAEVVEEPDHSHTPDLEEKRAMSVHNSPVVQTGVHQIRQLHSAGERSDVNINVVWGESANA